MSSCVCTLRTPFGATSTRNTRISSRLMRAALLTPVPDVAAIGLSTSPPAPGDCATAADPIHNTATTANASVVLITRHLLPVYRLPSPVPFLAFRLQLPSFGPRVDDLICRIAPR